MTQVARFKSTGRRMDDPPKEPQFFWVETEGDPIVGFRPVPGERAVSHVTAHNEEEAREMVELLEEQYAEHYGTKPWRIFSVRSATEHVDANHAEYGVSGVSAQ